MFVGGVFDLKNCTSWYWLVGSTWFVLGVVVVEDVCLVVDELHAPSTRLVFLRRIEWWDRWVMVS